MTSAVLALNGVSKRLGRHQVLADADLEVGVGESVALVGRNGSGKSTLLRVVTGVLDPDEGHVEVLGEHGVAARRHIGYLPHDAPIPAGVRVDRFIAHIARLRGVRRRDLSSRVEWAMAATACDKMAHRLGGHLSRGYRQRVGLAAALVHQPQVLVLDEPFTALDTSVLASLRSALREFTDGGSILVASHPHPDLAAVCDRTVAMSGGRPVSSSSGRGLVVHLGVAGSDDAAVDAALGTLLAVVAVEPLRAPAEIVRRRVVLAGPDTRSLSEHLLDARLAVCELEVQPHG